MTQDVAAEPTGPEHCAGTLFCETRGKKSGNPSPAGWVCPSQQGGGRSEGQDGSLGSREGKHGVFRFRPLLGDDLSLT